MHVDIVNSWTTIYQGGPEVLLSKSMPERNLFLCYPDEAAPLAITCLNNFSGDYIIHVGELISTGTFSYPQAAWGRTSSADFQVALAEDIHCLLVKRLPRFPFSRDCISVWKRTQWVRGKQSAQKLEELDADGETITELEANSSISGVGYDKSVNVHGDDGEGADDDHDSGGDDDDDLWANIPIDERLPVDAAAPCLAHLS